MRSIVFQSFRTTNVPRWITMCMDTVRHWARKQKHDYVFYDDEFFGRVPEMFRPRASKHKCILSDYARIVVARELLDQGYDRAIWVDADALVFDPDNFQIPISSGYAFTREVWLHRTFLHSPQFKLTVNNSVSVFCHDEHFSDFYLEAARHILSTAAGPLMPTCIGTDLLVGLRRAVDFPLLDNVGIFGPEMTYRYLHNDAKYLRPYLAFQTAPIAAANLCFSKLGETYHFPGAKTAWTLTHDTATELINRLLADKGASLNQHFTAPYHSISRDEFAHPLSPFLSLKETYLSLRHTLKTAITT